MILADKIAALRKKSGWSQEELAQQLNVTRQSVSKWEGAQSVPDIDKILQMSRLFGVSTDYLLKDELEEPELAATAEEDAQALRRVTLAEASEYLRLRKKAAPKRAICPTFSPSVRRRRRFLPRSSSTSGSTATRRRRTSAATLSTATAGSSLPTARARAISASAAGARRRIPPLRANGSPARDRISRSTA